MQILSIYDIIPIMMSNYVKKLYNLIPRYGWVMIICALGSTFVAYYGSRLITADLPKYSLSTSWDEAIPFRTEWIIIYVLSYIQWAIGYIVAGRERKKLCYQILGGNAIAKFFCLLCFLFFPLTISRPEVVGNAPWDWLTSIIYALDTPDALFPSIHCLESYVFFRGAMLSEKMPRWYVWAMGCFSLMVFASTVLVKQHFLADIVAGIIVGEIGLQIAKFIVHKKGIS